jgi:hypothetical protein
MMNPTTPTMLPNAEPVIDAEQAKFLHGEFSISAGSCSVYASA